MSTSIAQPVQSIPLSVKLVSFVIVPTHVLQSLLVMLFLSVFPAAAPKRLTMPDGKIEPHQRTRRRPLSLSSTVSSSPTLVGTTIHGCNDDISPSDQCTTMLKEDDDFLPINHACSLEGIKGIDCQLMYSSQALVRRHHSLSERFQEPSSSAPISYAGVRASRTVDNLRKHSPLTTRFIEIIPENQPPEIYTKEVVFERGQNTEQKRKPVKKSRFVRFSHKVKKILHLRPSKRTGDT